MLISKKQGEKLSIKELNTVYGGCGCGGNCGDCDCTSSNGDRFFGSFDPEMKNYDSLMQAPATP
jgi:bacteriocin-like protein